MYKFSFQSDENIRKDMQAICEMIKEQFDVIALQEIFTPNAMKYLLLRNLGSSWDGRWGQPKTRSPQAAEGYAFLWNKNKFKLVETENNPQIIESYHCAPLPRLLRNPYFIRLIPVHGPFFELRLLNTHIRYGKGENDFELEECEISPGAVQMRKDEFEILVRNICANVEERRYGNNRDAYTFLLGDYNLNLKTGTNPYPYLSEYIEVRDGRVIKNFKTVQADKTTLKRSDKVDSETIDKYANNYDHFTYNESFMVNNRGIGLKSRRIDTLKMCEGNVEKHRKEISDHVPILLEMDFHCKR